MLATLAEVGAIIPLATIMCGVYIKSLVISKDKKPNKEELALAK